MSVYLKEEGYRKHVKSIKKNREYIINIYLNKYNDLIMETYFYLKMRYIEENKDMFINNSTARNHLIEEEALLDIIFEREEIFLYD